MNYRPMTRIDYLLIHCSASDATQDWTVEDIRWMHKRKGWRDVGYHFIIRRDGVIEEGRPIDMPGAHHVPVNGRSIATCMIGGSPKIGSPEQLRGLGENNFTDLQWAALGPHIHGLHDRHPAALIKGHRQLSPDKNGDGRIDKWEYYKACPSFDVEAWWGFEKDGLCPPDGYGSL